MLAVMLLHEQDKEALVIDLLNKGHTTREIAKMAHVSFSYIKKIRMKLTGEISENLGDISNNKPLSLSSQAFKLFLDGKSLVDVTISLDVSTEQVIRIHKDYLTLKKTSKIVTILNEYRDSIPAFLTWFDYIEKNNVKVTDITNAIDYIKYIGSYGRSCV
jgi:hypothetical protein